MCLLGVRARIATQGLQLPQGWGGGGSRGGERVSREVTLEEAGGSRSVCPSMCRFHAENRRFSCPQAPLSAAPSQKCGGSWKGGGEEQKEGGSWGGCGAAARCQVRGPLVGQNQHLSKARGPSGVVCIPEPWWPPGPDVEQLLVPGRQGCAPCGSHPDAAGRPGHPVRPLRSCRERPQAASALRWCRCRHPAPIRGFWIVPDILGPTMVCITSTYECLIRPLL